MPAGHLGRTAAGRLVAVWAVVARRARRMAAAVVLVAVLLVNGAQRGQW